MSDLKGAGFGLTLSNNTIGTTDTTGLVYNTAGRYNLHDSGQHNIVFHGKGGREVGRMDFGDGELKFEGNAAEASMVFIQWCRSRWSDLRDNDKREVLQQVVDDLMQEASGELYSEGEKIAILTCMQRVQARKKQHEAPQNVETYAQNLAKSMQATKEAVAVSVLGALAPEGKSL